MLNAYKRRQIWLERNVEKQKKLISYIEVCSEIERSDAGTLNLSSCIQPDHDENKPDKLLGDALHKATTFRDMAEQRKAENRQLIIKFETNRKIDSVRQFWRNKILERRCRGGNMVMLAISGESLKL